MTEFKIFLSIAIAICNLVVFYNDIRFRTVKHRFVIIIIILGVISLVFSNNVIWQIASSFTIFCVFFILWIVNIIGGGDVKLIGALFIGIAPEYSIIALATAGILGGVQILLMWVSSLITHKDPFSNGIPYTIPLGLSGWFFFTLSLI
ncbi:MULTISPECIES: prepilin peptidase [unclassified Vibrio]|uniref:A24 family peptidase n=1 Tax=unclassified Vibrio TaxID=2614977 RepID=UPI00354D3FD4